MYSGTIMNVDASTCTVVTSPCYSRVRVRFCACVKAGAGAAFLCTRKSTFFSTGIRFKDVVLETYNPYAFVCAFSPLKLFLRPFTASP